MSYSNALTEAMTWLGEQDTVFIGQQCRYPGNAMWKTLSGVPMDKRIEFPVAEDFQLGASIGMALTCKTVVSIFPRMDFLMCAMNQLVNHLDKLEQFTHGQYEAKVIIRVGIGSKSPLYPGVQHCSDYTEFLQKMLQNIVVAKIEEPHQAMPYYVQAFNNRRPSLIVEDMSLYA